MLQCTTKSIPQLTKIPIFSNTLSLCISCTKLPYIMTGMTPSSLAWSHGFSSYESQAFHANAALVDDEAVHKRLSVPLVVIGKQLSTRLRLSASDHLSLP